MSNSKMVMMTGAHVLSMMILAVLLIIRLTDLGACSRPCTRGDDQVCPFDSSSTFVGQALDFPIANQGAGDTRTDGLGSEN